MSFSENFAYVLNRWFTAEKMKFSTKDFFSKCDQSAVSCGFGHIYWRNPEWKTSFFVQWLIYQHSYEILIFWKNDWWVCASHISKNRRITSFTIKQNPFIYGIMKHIFCSKFLRPVKDMQSFIPCVSIYEKFRVYGNKFELFQV